MNATTPLKRKNVFHYLPELWYILLLVCWLVPNMLIMNGTITLLSLAILALLIKQLFKESTWMSIFLGVLLSVGSMLMLKNTLSEYSEFQLKTDPGILRSLLVSILVIGTSLVFSLRMLFRGMHRMN